MADFPKKDDEYFRQRFNTKLTPQEESSYQQWLSDLGKQRGRSAADDDIDYDMRGAWKAGAGMGDNGHFTDQFKKPNHPTFSTESQYHGAVDADGEEFKGGEWGEDDGKTTFTPGPTNQTYWPKGALQQYMQSADPDVVLK